MTSLFFLFLLCHFFLIKSLSFPRKEERERQRREIVENHLEEEEERERKESVWGLVETTSSFWVRERRVSSDQHWSVLLEET